LGFGLRAAGFFGGSSRRSAAAPIAIASLGGGGEPEEARRAGEELARSLQGKLCLVDVALGLDRFRRHLVDLGPRLGDVTLDDWILGHGASNSLLQGNTNTAPIVEGKLGFLGDVGPVAALGDCPRRSDQP